VHGAASPARSLTLRDVREALKLDRAGRPRCPDNRRILQALTFVASTDNEEAIHEIVWDGFLVGAAERYAMHIEPQLRMIDGGCFAMGSHSRDLGHFCGESPQHQVALSPFAISTVPVTNALYAIFDGGRRGLPRSADNHPVVDVTWYDAAIFAAWFDCRLPTEAQWEFACGVGSPEQWCCDEADLPRYAWYSENSFGMLHPVATRAANALGLFDFHGLVWEWCRDDYDAAFYSRAPGRDPLNFAAAAKLHALPRHKVTRGGSFQALAEMCRSRFRFHEPAGFWARDLGFRLIRDIDRTL